ncbi:MAG: endonuclease/exonuclease/phosphatase family protein, partial [Mycobacterium sp.]
MVLAVCALALSMAALILRALPLANNIALFVAVGSPYVALAAVVVLVFSVVYRRVVMTAVAAAIVAANVVIQVPWYYFGKPTDTGAHVSIRVLSANLRLGQADVLSLVDLARASADVITLSEMTPDWLRRFYATGARTEFPHSVLVPALGAGGFGLWSRFPLEVVTPMKGGSMIAARVQVPGVRVDPVIASVHIINPLALYGQAFGQWQTGIAAAKVRMAGLAATAGSGAVIVAGDFNSTPDMRQF